MIWAGTKIRTMAIHLNLCPLVKSLLGCTHPTLNQTSGVTSITNEGVIKATCRHLQAARHEDRHRDIVVKSHLHLAPISPAPGIVGRDHVPILVTDIRSIITETSRTLTMLQSVRAASFVKSQLLLGLDVLLAGRMRQRGPSYVITPDIPQIVIQRGMGEGLHTMAVRSAKTVQAVTHQAEDAAKMKRSQAQKLTKQRGEGPMHRPTY